jgi:TRAP-type C4-dicarboxylate transport system permease small subunit
MEFTILQEIKDMIERGEKDGWLQFLITIIFFVISVLFLWAGYKLILSGTTGSWKIVSNLKGWELYAASISPGLIVVLLAALILIYGLPGYLRFLTGRNRKKEE